MPAIEITQHCRFEHCLPKLASESKEEVITELVEAFVKSGVITEDDSLELIGQVLAREEGATTGIGKGIAMPHARQCNIVDETLIAVGIHQKGVDFDAVDGQPVHIIFLIASPDNDQYLGVAGRIASVARDDVEMKALLRQNTPKSIHKFLEESWSAANA